MSTDWFPNGAAFVAHGNGMPPRVFTSLPMGFDWANGTGWGAMITTYPMDEPAYEWARRIGAEHRAGSPSRIATYTNAVQPHWHFDSDRISDYPEDEEFAAMDVAELWIFQGSRYGERIDFPSAVFTSLEKAETWVLRSSLTGVLTQYLPIEHYVLAVTVRSRELFYEDGILIWSEAATAQ